MKFTTTINTLFGKTILAILLFSFSFSQKAEACSPMTMPTLNSQTLTGCILDLQWTSNTAYACTYSINIEIVCINMPFTGVENYFSTPITKPTAAPMAYPLQTIDICTLCPGVTYQWRAKECTSPSPTTCTGYTPTYTFTVPGSPVAVSLTATGTPTTVCAPSTSQLQATPSGGCGPFTFAWTPVAGLSNPNIANPTALPAVTTTYTCTVTDLCQLTTATSTITITLGAGPATSSVQTNNNCFAGTSGAATVTAVGASPFTYSWTPSGGTNASATGLAAGTYTCTVTDVNGCTSTVVVVITAPPQLTVTSTSTQSSCGAPNGTGTATVSGGTPGYTYSWSPSGGNGAGATGLTPGNYTVTVTDLNGCTATSSITVGSLPYPVAVATAMPPTGPSPVVVTFTNTSTGGTSYIWYFGNGDSSLSMTPPPYVYTTPGTYTIMLVVSNGTCNDTLYFTVEVFGVSSLIVPNVFSPNGDLYNELFHVSGANLIEFKMDIFDRWGLLMGSLSDHTKGWNGKAKSGSDAPEGTYYYVIAAKGDDEKDYLLKGSFMLLRK